MLKYVHFLTSTDSIKLESSKHRHVVCNILNSMHRITKEPLNMFFVDFERSKNNKNIYKLFNRIIRVKPPNKSYGIEQRGYSCRSKINSKVPEQILRIIANVPWYIFNFGLHKELKISTVNEMIKIRSSLMQHTNPAIQAIHKLLKKLNKKNTKLPVFLYQYRTIIVRVPDIRDYEIPVL